MALAFFGLRYGFFFFFWGHFSHRLDEAQDVFGRVFAIHTKGNAEGKQLLRIFGRGGFDKCANPGCLLPSTLLVQNQPASQSVV